MIGFAFEAIQNLHYVRNLGATSCRSWKSFPPCPTLGGPLKIPLQPLSGPSPKSFPLFALRGHLLPPSRPSAAPYRSPANPFDVLRGPSWKCFRLCLFALRGHLLPPTRPLANPYRSISNPFVALRRSSCPFVDIFLPFPFRPSWTSSSPFPTLGEPLSIHLQPLRGPSPFFVSLRGYLFVLPAPSWIPFVDFFFLRVHSWPFVVLPAPSWIPSSIIVITFHHFKPPRGLSPICARIPVKRRLIPQVRAFAPAPPPFPFGRRAPAG